MAGKDLSPAVIRHEKHLADKLLPQANEYHNAAAKSAKSTIEYAVNCGKVLIQIKGIVKHGEFESYIEMNADFGVSTSQKYMKLASMYDELIEDFGPGQMSEMSIREGLGHLVNKHKKLTQERGKAERCSASVVVATPSHESPITDECPKGGSHEWVEDHELGEVVCSKCHDPRAAHDAGAAPPGASQSTQADHRDRGSDPDGQERHDRAGDAAGLSRQMKAIEDAFGELLRMIDATGKGGTEKIRHQLDLAYMEFNAWRK